MSVFPISLPLYPIMNASETVQKLLEKDAEAKKSGAPDDDRNDIASMNETALANPSRQADEIKAVESTAVTIEAMAARAGGEMLVNAQGAQKATNGYQMQSEATRSGDLSLLTVADQDAAPAALARLNKVS